MVLQAAVGFLGFALHLLGDIHAVGPTLFGRVVYGDPMFAPMLFPDMVLPAGIGLWVLYRRLPSESSVQGAQPNGTCE